MTAKAAPFASREITINRVFAAPRTLVFAAWTEPKRMAQWWGPHGFTNPVCELDVRPGGALHIVMRAPDGTDYPMNGVFREVVAPERLAFTFAALDQGKPVLEGLTTVTFAEDRDGTKLTVHSRATALVDYAARMIEGMEAGWTQSIERLEALVKKP
jgi:uncharacterized protein YndB with AHSA1/START domain